MSPDVQFFLSHRGWMWPGIARCWLWWRHLDTAGIAGESGDDALELLETLADESDYFATL